METVDTCRFKPCSHIESLLEINTCKVLIYSSSQLQRDAEAKVSPGPLPEADFIDTAGRFKLPQYVTGFLLARGIEMQFDGVNKESSRVIMAASQVSSSTSYSGSGGWGPFSFSGKSEYASQSQSKIRSSASFQASSSATGLKIKIPGVQIIGYFTQVVNKFPISN